MRIDSRKYHKSLTATIAPEHPLGLMLGQRGLRNEDCPSCVENWLHLQVSEEWYMGSASLLLRVVSQ